MRILVYGAGSLGSLLGALLSREHLVALLTRKEHAEEVAKNGLQISGMEKETAHLMAISSLTELSWEPDLVLLTVKSYDTRNACEDLLDLEPTPTISFQNGLGNLEIMRNILGEECVYGATTSMGAMLLSPGKVRYTGKGLTRIQRYQPVDEYILTTFEGSLRERGLEVEAVEDIRRTVWEKAAVNLGINYLTALTRKQNGVLAEQWPDLEKFVLELMGELVEVAKEEGVALDVNSCVQSVLDVATNTAVNRSSMLQDIERGKKTENESLAGYLLERGEEHRLSLPRIKTLYHLVALAEAGAMAK